MENVENKILEVLEDVGEKMAPVIKVRREMLMVRKCFLMIVFQNPNGLERNLAENFTWTTSWGIDVYVKSCISVKFFCQDFLLKTTNLMTYAARDKNSLLNFLDENLVIWKENLNLRCESIIKIWWDIMRSSHWEPGQMWWEPIC